MWDAFMARLPGAIGIICIILAFVIPFSFNKMNQAMHKYGDPPWKKEGNN